MNPGGLNTLVTVAAPRTRRRAPLPEILMVQTGLDICHAIEQTRSTTRSHRRRESTSAQSRSSTLAPPASSSGWPRNTLLDAKCRQHAPVLALGRMLASAARDRRRLQRRARCPPSSGVDREVLTRPRPRGMPNESALVRAGRCCWTPPSPRSRRDHLRDRSAPASRGWSGSSNPDELRSEDTDPRNEFHRLENPDTDASRSKGDLDAVSRRGMLLTALSALTEAPRNPMDDPAGARTPARHARGRVRRNSAPLPRLAGEAPIEGGERPHLSLHVNAAPTCPQRGGSRMGWLGRRIGDLFGEQRQSHALAAPGVTVDRRPHADWRATATHADRPWTMECP